MQQLYNELMQPITKDGEIQNIPAINMRAARALKQADEINTTNLNLIMQLQNNNQELLEQLKVINESLHEARRQVSSMGCGGEQPSRSDSTSEADVQTENKGTSTDGVT